MLDLILFLVTAWVVTAAGRNALRASRLEDDLGALMERNLFGFGVGMGLLAAGMLTLGLAQGLYPQAGAALLLALTLSGFRQHRAMAREMGVIARRGLRLSVWGWALTAAFGAFALVSFVGCFAPPTLLEWDSLAYHLADPKLYLQAHRLYHIPWEDHSNFGFTAEMWYLYGLLLRGAEDGVPLAKLFHFACGAGTCLAIYALGVRCFTPTVGKAAALLFATTPLVFWEAGTAYADLATVFYTTLTLLALTQGMASRDERRLRLGALLMGLTLSTKATALGTLALLALGLLGWRLRVCRQPAPQAMGAAARWCLLALLIGSPWFVKSVIYTGNPVYPFFYGLFGGRGWSAAAAAYYQDWNAAFGMGHRAADAILIPWNLSLFLLPGHLTSFPKPFNDYQTEFGALTPVLLGALFFPVFSRGASGPTKALGAFALGSLLLWFATMQYVRYLLPILPVFCLLAAWVLVRALGARWLSGYALACLGLLSLGFSLLVGGSLLATQAPVVLGWEPRAVYITRNFDAYPAMRFINTRLPRASKIVMYGCPLGFYCDRPYVWGEPIHGTFIPYDTFHSADDLRRFFASKGITHILVDTHPNRFALTPPAPGASNYTAWVYALTAGTGPPLFYERGVGVWPVPNHP